MIASTTPDNSQAHVPGTSRTGLGKALQGPKQALTALSHLQPIEVPSLPRLCEAFLTDCLEPR